MRALLGIVFAAALAAQDLKRVEPQGYLSDFANVVSPEERRGINAYLRSLEERTGAQIAIVTVATLNGEPIEDAAIDLYRRWGVGRKETNEGALYLFAIQDRKSRLEVGYGLEAILTDGAAGDILRSMRPALRERKYGAAFQEAARLIGERIASAKNVASPDGLPPAPVYQPGPLGDLPMDKIFGYTMIVLFVVVFAWQAYSTRGNWRGGGRGGGGGFYVPGGGGFGGSSSGGSSSWGGFGGGDSGGGGASSDW